MFESEWLSLSNVVSGASTLFLSDYKGLRFSRKPNAQTHAQNFQFTSAEVLWNSKFCVDLFIYIHISII